MFYGSDGQVKLGKWVGLGNAPGHGQDSQSDVLEVVLDAFADVVSIVHSFITWETLNWPI